jgi:hypothetical protein
MGMIKNIMPNPSLFDLLITSFHIMWKKTVLKLVSSYGPTATPLSSLTALRW